MLNPSVRAAIGLSLALSVLPASGQETEERRRFLDPDTPVSDDPRRVPAAGRSTEAAAVIVLRGGNVFDATGAAARPASILVRGNEIESILPPDSSDWPEEAEVIELRGKMVLPGLVDLHTHLTYYDPRSSPDRQRSLADATLRATPRYPASFRR